MPVNLVHVHVKPEHVDAFIEATRLNHLGSLREPGNRRFDVLRSTIDPNRFLLYEWWADGAASAAHKETDHYARWRDTVADWLAEPRVGVPYQGLFPDAEALGALGRGS